MIKTLKLLKCNFSYCGFDSKIMNILSNSLLFITIYLPYSISDSDKETIKRIFLKTHVVYMNHQFNFVCDINKWLLIDNHGHNELMIKEYKGDSLHIKAMI